MPDETAGHHAEDRQRQQRRDGVHHYLKVHLGFLFLTICAKMTESAFAEAQYA
jgi:hypothetical protein